MNGYISPCAGDTHPPIFRSPIKDMEDILANEVICCIYRLPDAHEHITRPPAGVTFPPKMVQLSDLKSQPVLWHEDSGRRPLTNGKFPASSQHLVERHNPPGSVFGPKLGEASHRLIVNSLQLKAERNRISNNMQAPPPPYAIAPYIPPLDFSVNYVFHNQGEIRMFPLERDISSAVPVSEVLCKLGPSSQGYYHYQINDPSVLKKLNFLRQEDRLDGGSMPQHKIGGDYQQIKRKQPCSGIEEQRKRHRYNLRPRTSYSTLL